MRNIYRIFLEVNPGRALIHSIDQSMLLFKADTNWRYMMNLDIRLPIACLFSIIGLLLMGYGLLSPDAAVKCVFVNVNLVWGGVMLAFAVVLYIAAKWAQRREGE